MKKKYCTFDWEPFIMEVEIESENDVFVWIKGIRHLKKGDVSTYFDKLEEAKLYHINNAYQSVLNAKSKLDRAESNMKKIQVKMSLINF